MADLFRLQNVRIYSEESPDMLHTIYRSVSFSLRFGNGTRPARLQIP
jgi:hypothetical protein